MQGKILNLHDVVSHRDAVALLETIHLCSGCRNEEQYRIIINKLHDLISYDYAISVVADINRDGTLNAYDAMNLGYPSEWIAMYIAHRERERDPILRANYQNFRLQYFQEVLKRYEHPKEFKATAYDFGIKDGYVHGIKNHSGARGSMFCFAGRRIDRDKRMEAILELVVPHLHQAFLRIASLKVDGDRKVYQTLSLKEKEVLKWLKQGKSTWNISAILKISERTVKFHVGNIMRKLDASSRTHAVAIAIEQRLVDIE